MNHKCLEAILEKWDKPFYKPVTFHRETGEINADKWAIKMYSETPAGAIKRGSSAVLFFEYCPVCGERLEPAAAEGESE
jgi:hypothetical protein